MDVQMYSWAFKPDRATVRTIPHTPALGMSVTLCKRSQLDKTYKTPRLRPQAIVIFSLRFMLRSQITNQGRIAKEKSAATNHAAMG